MRTALDIEPGVALFQRYVDDFGLRYGVATRKELRLPAYAGSLELPHVTRPGA